MNTSFSPSSPICLDGEIPGAVNLRDVGGHRTPQGRVRTGLLFRSGVTHHISPEGLVRLRDRHGLKRILDLRSDEELKRDGVGPFEAHGIAFHHVAVYGVTALTPEQQEARYRQMLTREYDWGERYKVLVTDHPGSFAGLFRTLAAPGALPALFHCSAGRDRTGIAAAFVLELLGVSREDIATDYATTGRHLRPHVHRYTRIKSTMSFNDEEMAEVLETVPAHMHRFLDWMQAEHGGAEAFLLRSGVQTHELAALRASLHEPN